MRDKGEIILEYADLHMHSTHSDGKLTVEEIIHHAKNMNLKCISITDHDTIDGTVEAINFKDKGNVDIIPGIEFSTLYEGEEIHILGYLFDCYDKEFNSFIRNMQEHRSDRAVKIIDKFRSIGIDLTMEELLQKSRGESIGRPHFAYLLMEKGYASSVQDAFKKYLLPGSVCYVERFKITPEDTIKRIREAGGVSILAHPGLIKNQDLVKSILEMKIDGIEVYHSKHTSKQNREYYYLARENQLFITGGSDCHSKIPNEKPFIGSVKIPYSYVENIKQSKVQRCL